MRLLSKNDYKCVEDLLVIYGYCEKMEEIYSKAIQEIISFFDIPLYKELLEVFYLNRREYRNRYPTNPLLYEYLSERLNLQKPTLYVMRKEIVYKAAMIFYKHGLLL